MEAFSYCFLAGMGCPPLFFFLTEGGQALPLCLTMIFPPSLGQATVFLLAAFPRLTAFEKFFLEKSPTFQFGGRLSKHFPFPVLFSAVLTPSAFDIA